MQPLSSEYPTPQTASTFRMDDIDVGGDVYERHLADEEGCYDRLEAAKMRRSRELEVLENKRFDWSRPTKAATAYQRGESGERHSLLDVKVTQRFN